MASLDNPFIEVKTIEVLLRGRTPLSWEADCADMAMVAQAISGFAGPQSFEQVSDHVKQCRACREAVLMLHVIDGAEGAAVEPVGPLPSPWKGSEGKGARSGKALSIAASILLVLGIVMVALLRSGSPAPTETEMVVKGARDSFFVGVRRGAHRFGVEPFDRLEKDDRLGMFYTSEQPGYLMVVSMDDSGAVSLLHPAGGFQSGAIAAGREVSLSDGALVQEGSGCEWIVAAFSDAPLRFTEVTRAVKSGTMAVGPCELRVSVPGARNVRVLPFRR